MLQCQRENISTSADTRIECRSERAISQHARNSAAGKTIVADKGAANDNATIRLNNDCVDVAVRSVAGIKTQVNAAVTIEPREIEALGQIDLGKLPADNNAAISLQRQRERSVVDPVAEAEGLIDTSVRVQSANAIVRQAVKACKSAGHDDAAVRLKNSRGNLAVRSRA